MRFSILEDFIAVSQLKSFSRAAELRNSTQSALSRRIQSLENWLGAALIDRRATPPVLTPVGDMFLAVAEDALRLLRHGREEAEFIAQNSKSTVSFAVTHSLSLTFFPRWIRDIEKQIGALTLRLLSHDGSRCREALRNGDCHFMICHFDERMRHHFNIERLRSVIVGRDRLIAVCRPKSNCQPLARLPGDSNSRVPFLNYTPDSSIGKSLSAFLENKKHYLRPCFETSLAEGVKAMIMEGHGVGWLPESVIREELQNGVLVRSGDQSWDVETEIRTFRPVTRLPPEAEQLWRLISAPNCQPVSKLTL